MMAVALALAASWVGQVERAAPAHAAVGSWVSEAQPAVRFSGRFTAVDINPFNVNEAIGAAESGGLFKSTDNGATWRHIDGVAPFRMSDVRYSRFTRGVVVATVENDARASRTSGILTSKDSGATWSEASPFFPNACEEFGAFGIAFGPSGNAYVGIHCGLAVLSTDLNRYIVSDPTPTQPSLGKAVFGVDVYPYAVNGFDVVDICGDSGHHRSTLSGVAPWSADHLGTTCLEPATHVIARSPFDKNTLFVNAGIHNGTEILKMSTNAGSTWATVGNIPVPKDAKGNPALSRQPTVRTHASPVGVAYDVYFSNPNNFYRMTCQFGAACPTNPSWQAITVDHADVTDAAWGVGGCPLLISGDFGIARRDAGQPGMRTCVTSYTSIGGGTTTGLNALQINEVTGQIHPTGDRETDLYFISMDDWMWASADRGETWPNSQCCEGLGIQLPHSSPTSTGLTAMLCSGCYYAKLGAHLATNVAWAVPGSAPNLNHGEPILLRDGSYVQRAESLDAAGNSKCCNLYLSTNQDTAWTKKVFVGDSLRGNYAVTGTTANPILWGSDEPTFSGGAGARRLLRVQGFLSGTGTVDYPNQGLDQLANICLGEGAFACPYIFNADPTDATHVIAEDSSTTSPGMKVRLGTGSFALDRELSQLVTGNGAFTHDTGGGATQARSIAFDPSNARRILVGTETAGIIATQDGGRTWGKVPGSEKIPAVSSFFFDDDHGVYWASSYGRGLWKVRFDTTDLRIAKSGPSRIVAGTTGTFHITVSNATSVGAGAGTTVLDYLPPGLAFVSSTLRSSNGADLCESGPPGPTEIGIRGTTVICQVGDLEGLREKPFDIVVRGTTDAGYGCTSVVNTAYVNSVANDIDIHNNTAAIPVTVAGPLCANSQLRVIGGVVSTQQATAVLVSTTGSVTAGATAFLETPQTSFEALVVSCSVYKPAASDMAGNIPVSVGGSGTLYMSGVGLVSQKPWLIKAVDDGLPGGQSGDRIGVVTGAPSGDGACGAANVLTSPATFGDLIQIGIGTPPPPQ